MSQTARIMLTLVLLSVMAFCIFGFLAAAEPGVSGAWRIGYGAAMVAGLAGIVWAWAHASRRTR